MHKTDPTRGVFESQSMEDRSNDPRPAGEENALAKLEQALSAWTGQGKPGSLARWLERELDPDGVPKHLAVAAWTEGLRQLASAWVERSEGWTDEFDARVEGWFRATLRYARPDGASVFGPKEPPEDVRRLCRFWAQRLSDPGLSTVLDWWFPRPGHDQSRHAPPPLPADSRPDRPLAVLRANWVRDGDLVAIDHRVAGTSTAFELVGLGRSWLGPSWHSGEVSARAVARARGRRSGSPTARPTWRSGRFALAPPGSPERPFCSAAAGSP